MRSGKGKRKQTSINQKEDDIGGTFISTQETVMSSTQQLHHDSQTQHQNQPSDNTGEDEHSDGVSSQRSWSPVIKSRRRFSASEILYLEAEYAQDINPSTDQIEKMAETIGTTRRVITTWFQNHRAKGKRNKTDAAIKKHIRPKHVHAITATNKTNNKSRARKNLTQPEMIGQKHRPSCHCINQATVGDDYHAVFTPSSTNLGHAAAVSDTAFSLDMSDPSPSTINVYDPSYFVPDPTAIPPLISTPTTTWNHSLYPTFSIPFPSSSSFNWPQDLSVPHNPPALTSPCQYLNTPPPSLANHSTLPQCCVDELYTGYPCPLHTVYL